MRARRRFGCARTRCLVGLALVVAMLAIAPQRAAAADSPSSPFVLQPGTGPFDQYGYAPAYTRNVPVFDSGDRAYIRSRTSDTDHTSYVHVIAEGQWTKLDFRETLRAAYPTFAETVGAAGSFSESIIFDRHDRAYNPLTIRLKDGSTRNVLLVSWDACRSWKVFPLPSGDFVVEHWVGHNEIDGPPFLAFWRPTAGTTPRGLRNTLWVTQPRLDGEALVIPQPVRVTRACLGLHIGAGTGSFAVTQGERTTFSWVEATRSGERTTPEFVATYDHKSATASAPVLLAKAPGVNDTHNVPSLCCDSRGYLHFVAGTHGTSVLYARSLEPYSAATWTHVEPVLGDGYVPNPDSPEDQIGRQTYNSFLCDGDNTLHLVTRQWRRGVDSYHAGSSYGALVHQSRAWDGAWSRPTIVVVAAEAGYGLFNHKLALDHRGRLFLSCSYVGGTELADHRERIATMAKLGKPVPNLGRYRRRLLLVSDDGGANWRLAMDADLAAPGQAVPEEADAGPAALEGPIPPAELLWSWLKPLPQGNQIADIAFANSRFGWAVGTHGSIIRSADGGLTWRRQASGTTRDLLAVSAVDGRTAWAVGEQGEVLLTVDGGRSWAARGVEGGRALLDVHALSVSSAVAVGLSGQVLLTSDGGTTWTRGTTRTVDSLFAVTFAGGKLGWACGSRGRVLVTRNGGKTWSSRASGVSATLHTVSFFDSSRGVAAGDDGALISTRDGGATWRSASIVGGPALLAVRMVSRSRAYAVGEGGAFLVTVDGGRTWRRRHSPFTGTVGGLAADAAGRVWAGGAGGVAVRSSDFGRSWTSIEPGLTVALHAVAGSDAGLLATGSRGRMLLSPDGVAWRSQLTGTTAHLRAVATVGTDAWAVGDGGTVVRSVDAGASWRRLALPQTGDLYGVTVADGSVWLVGDRGTLLRRQDAGDTWERHSVTPESLYCATFLGSLGWVGGGDPLGDERALLLRTEDGGSSWSEVELPVWGVVRSLHFADELRGWAVTVDWGQDGDVRSGAVLHTEDGGATWVVQVRSPEALTALSMSPDGDGWAIGEGGVAFQTTDGGSTWVSRDVDTHSTLRGVAVSRAAAIVVGDGGALLRGAAAVAAADSSD